METLIMGEVASSQTTATDFLDSNPNPSFLYSLRSLGYVNTSAFNDIIDNALDKGVNATEVQVNIKHSKGQYVNIDICDNGAGMDRKTLEQATKLGSQTGKNRGYLGCYGTGLKSAASSMGLQFDVLTKSVNDQFWIATYDIDEKVQLNNFRTPVRIGTEEEYKEFTDIIGTGTGTIIRISKLDNITDNNPSQFADTVRKALGKTFKYYIDNGVSIKVNNKIVESIDPMYREQPWSKQVTNNESFEYDGLSFRFNVFNIGNIDKSYNQSLEFPKNQRNAGLYVYRNYRMVGQGLDLGMVGKLGDGYKNGVRIELFVQGESDELFGSSLTKMIHEKDASEIDQGFKDKCSSLFGPYILQIQNQEKKERESKSLTDDKKKSMDNIFESINKNPFVKVEKTKGKNYPDLDPKDKPEPTGRKNKFSPRPRKDLYTDYRVVKLDTGEIFRPQKENGLYIIELNENHPFWSEFLVHQDETNLGYILKLFVSLSISLESTGFYSDSIKNGLLNEFLYQTSQHLRKYIMY
jgi:hypothetical protein